MTARQHWGSNNDQSASTIHQILRAIHLILLSAYTIYY